MLLLSHRNPQRLPDMAASTLTETTPYDITQIFPHRDVDMWGRVSISRFRGWGVDES